ncbi:MAG TPA: LacI family DNA-binding transcriptional regulator [Cyclobacteriaceae bacterium]
MKKDIVTIKDIAKQLDISVSTVSRALSDSPVVKEATRKAVKELAKKLNYQPNFTALSLRSSTTRTLGIVIPQVVHEFFSSVITGIEDYANSIGYNVIICTSHESYEKEVQNVRTLINGRVDGVLICISKHTKNFDHLNDIKEKKLPLVFFDCICEDVASDKVVIDDYDAGYKAVNHLIAVGCKRIAHISGPIQLLINQHRFEGYKQALLDNNLPYDDKLVIHCDGGDYEHGYEVSSELFSRDAPDGLFCGTDMLAIGAIKNIKKNGLKIPDDIAVVGFSNWEISSLYEPSLSTLTQPGYEMGQVAANKLFEQINDPDHQFSETVLQSELVIRDSSKKK